MIEMIRKNILEILLVTTLLVVSGVAHGYNMFHFPYYENDEGVYMSQAWSVVETGELAPYTYWYDHAPAGWFFIAIWTKLTGGFFTFGMSVNSGRVFMLVLHVVATALLYYIARRLGGSKFTATIATLLFALTPLGLYFHRRVLLDNIMTFWVLAALAILLVKQIKLRHILTSGIMFGIAVLTKENAVFFGPAFLFLVYIRAHHTHRRFAILQWLVTSGMVVSLYFVYALMKNEFFPSGTFGSGAEHVSLLGTLDFQASREAVGSFWDFSVQTSEFWLRVVDWAHFDMLLVGGGILVLPVLIVMVLTKRYNRWVYILIFLLNALQWLFLARGGIILEFYIVPLIPTMALAIAYVIGEIVGSVYANNRYRALGIIIGLIVVATLLFVSSYQVVKSSRGNAITMDQTTAQITAVEWIRDNVPEESFIAIDNYSFLDLNSQDNQSGKVFRNAEWYWKIDYDDEIRFGLLHNDPTNIDVIAMTPQMSYDITTSGMSLLGTSLGLGKPVQILNGEGWDTVMWYPRHPRGVLERSWKSYKEHFITDRGMVIDPSKPDTATSEGQSYALLRAVWMDDPEQFALVYQWTQANMLNAQGLYSWKYDASKTYGENITQGSATDADQNIALALLFAGKKWNNGLYIEGAQNVLNAIWEHEVAYYNNTHYLVAGEWAKGKKVLTINPSYLSPAHYRIFADADPLHPWKELVDTSYEAIEKCMNVSINNKKGRLPPEWCSLNITNGKYGVSLSPQPTDTFYGFNAFRVPWHLALDLKWSNEQRANRLLGKFDILKKEWDNNARISATYTHEGEVWDNYESVAAYAGNIGIFMATDLKSAEDIYQTKILEKFYENSERSYWDDPKNYFTQNWAWFGTALYKDALPNLWFTNELI